MKYLLFYIFFILFFIKINTKESTDIFDYAKNLRFCGADLISKKIKYPEPKIRQNRTRHLSTVTYKPIRIYVETTYFDDQAESDESLKVIAPIIKKSLDKSVKAIKGLLEVEDQGDINYFKDIILEVFKNNSIPKWDPIFDNGTDIKSDYLIIVKFDIPKEFPEGVLASAVPVYLEADTHRPLVGLLTISTEKTFFSKNKVEQYFSEVILHELTHALGFINGMFQYFPNGLDATLGKSIIREYERTMIITPKVVETAKKYFNCSNIIGVELEDQGMEGSTGSHWDQRILLGDYMGAVIYQEEMVISEFTLALLEDSGWYKANYYTGGLMRFGKNKGCAFIEKNCLSPDYISEFDNEFFDINDAYAPSCSAGRQSRTYSILNTYIQYDPKYRYNFAYYYAEQIYRSGSTYTADYCFTHGQNELEYQTTYFTGNCQYGNGNYGNNIYYINQTTNFTEKGHPNSELPPELGEKYSDTSFCIMSSLTPPGKYKMYGSIVHSMCYQIHCSSSSLTIQINNDLIICPREGGNVKVEGYDGYLHCPDYNLMCSGTVLCNDMFDCIEKKSLVKESSYYYDYVPVTTQKFSKIRAMNLSNSSYELSEDGFCPKYCSQCYINKTCKICQEGQDCNKNKKTEGDDDDGNSKTTIWVVVSVVIVLVIVGIIVAVFLIYKKRNVEDISYKAEKITEMRNKDDEQILI